jgi:hypothetical protein
MFRPVGQAMQAAGNTLNRAGVGGPWGKALQTTGRNFPGMSRPQRPQPMVDALRRQPMNYGQQRAAQRRMQWSNMPQPSQQQLRDSMLRRKNPGAYHGMKELKPDRDGMLSSPWMDSKGMITKSGHRVSADYLRGQGYRWQPYKEEGFGERAGERGQSAGWAKIDPRHDQLRRNLKRGTSAFYASDPTNQYGS